MNLNRVSLTDLKKLRPFVPSEEYSILKNRKTSRLTRLNKKQAFKENKRNFEECDNENIELKSKFEKLK